MSRCVLRAVSFISYEEIWLLMTWRYDRNLRTTNHSTVSAPQLLPIAIRPLISMTPSTVMRMRPWPWMIFSMVMVMTVEYFNPLMVPTSLAVHIMPPVMLSFMMNGVWSRLCFVPDEDGHKEYCRNDEFFHDFHFLFYLDNQQRCFIPYWYIFFLPFYADPIWLMTILREAGDLKIFQF